MEITSSKSTVYSILKSVGYFLLWGVAFHLIIFLIIKISTGWTFKYLFAHPQLGPLNGLKIWFVAGLVYGFIHRMKKRSMGIKTWSRAFLYMILISAFISTLQLYYVHRKHTGWYDMAEPGKCMNKYHSFWLIQDHSYFAGIDQCLRSVNGVNYGTATNLGYEQLDYDQLTPRLQWILLAILLVTIIELFRRYGPIGFYKFIGSYGRYWRNGINKLNAKNTEMILAGAIGYMLILAFLPKIEGYPSSWLPLLVFVAALFLSFRLFISKRLANLPAAAGLPLWFLLITGITLSSLLLTILGIRSLYYLLAICFVIYLIVINKLPAAAVKTMLLLWLFFDADFLFADDGTWPSGGLDKLLSDGAGPTAVDNVVDLSDTVLPVVPFVETEPEPEETEVSLTEEELMGNTGNETEETNTEGTETESGTTENSEGENRRLPIDRPLGEDPPQ